MAFTDNTPIAANQVLNDVASMNANFTFLKDAFENFIGTWSDSVASGLFPARVKRTNTSAATYAVLGSDTIIEGNTSGANVELDLQAAATAGAGRVHAIKKVHASNSLIIDPNGSETIDGSATSRILTEDNEVIVLYCTGSAWEILYQYKPLAHSEERRSTFAWASTSNITLTPFVYRHNGTIDQYVYSDSDLTYVTASGGSNSASDDLGADEWHYVYIDDSAVVTAASNVISETELLNNTTAPTWSDSKGGWYNGADRCIFAIYSNSSSQLDVFYHDGGDYVGYKEPFIDLAHGALTGSTVVALTIPGFATRADLLISADTVTNTQSVYYGHSASPTVVLYSGSDMNATIQMFSKTSMAATIYLDESDASGGTAGVKTWGHYLPIGF